MPAEDPWAVGSPATTRQTPTQGGPPSWAWWRVFGTSTLDRVSGPEVYTAGRAICLRVGHIRVRARSGTAEDLTQPLIEAIHRVDPDLPGVQRPIPRCCLETVIQRHHLRDLSSASVCSQRAGPSRRGGIQRREFFGWPEVTRSGHPDGPGRLASRRCWLGDAPGPCARDCGCGAGSCHLSRRHQVVVQPALWRGPPRPGDLRARGGPDSGRRGTRHLGAGANAPLASNP